MTDADGMDASPMTALADQQWLMHQEMQTFMAAANGHDLERIIDIAVPRATLEIHLGRYRFAAPAVAGKCVLDMACGTGYGSQYLLKQGGAASVTGADADADAVRYAQLRYRQEHLFYRVADACAPWQEQHYDVVVSYETVEHVPYPDRMLDAIVAASTADGMLFISTPIRRAGRLADRPHYPFHLREWSVEEFTQLLNLYYDSVEVFGQHWEMRLRYRRIPQSVLYKVAQLQGRRVEEIHSYLTEVKPLHSAPDILMYNPSKSIVARCRGPHPAADREAVRRLCYGD